MLKSYSNNIQIEIKEEEEKKNSLRRIPRIATILRFKYN